MSIFESRLRNIRCKVWETGAPRFAFPEVSPDNPEAEELESRPNVGIAISGGGTRSASAGLGQLRALTQLDLLAGVRYLSAVSGGGWLATPYTFLPAAVTDDTFLGQVIPPKDLTAANLGDLDHNGFADAVARSGILDDFLGQALRLAGDETFGRALGEIFLERFGLDSLARLFSLNPGTVERLVERNGGDVRRDDFYVARPGRPFLVVGSTLLRQSNPEEAQRRLHFEITPLYVGTRVLHERAGSGGQHVGGGYVEACGYDSDAPGRAPGDDGLVRVRLGGPRHRLTLSDVLGCTGAAPAAVLDRLRLDFLGFPELKHWPVARRAGVAWKAKEYEMTDGGEIENLGVMPLLARKVQRMVVFVNTQDRLRGPSQINNSMPPLFGQTPDFTLNRVFPEEDYLPLVEALLARKAAGKSVLHRTRHRVQDNAHYGVEGGWSVEVLWVYNERVNEWEEELRPEIRERIGHGALGNFPNYRTFLQNPPAVIDLRPDQVDLLANLSCWNVTSNEELFRGFLSGD